MAKGLSSGGRPRQSGVIIEDPREGILVAAAALFAEKGFAQTRMSEVAKAAGLRQSSIYYWFGSKDVILREIMDQNRVSLTAARDLAGRLESAAARLYIVLYQDVVQMCSAPLNFYDLEEAAKNQPDVFGGFRADYAELAARLEDIVNDGVARGEFCDIDAGRRVRTFLSMNEGSQHRFHLSGGSGEEMRDLADAAAAVAVRSILRDVDLLPVVRAAAREGVAGYRAVGEQPTPRVVGDGLSADTPAARNESPVETGVSGP